MHGNDKKAWKCTVVDLVGEGSCCGGKLASNCHYNSCYFFLFVFEKHIDFINIKLMYNKLVHLHYSILKMKTRIYYKRIYPKKIFHCIGEL
jgi:hypothetical protein